MLKKFDVVLITWNDANGANPGWMGSDDVPNKLEPVVSVGFFFSETKESITIIQQRFENLDIVAGPLTIPKGTITKMTKLNVKK